MAFQYVYFTGKALITHPRYRRALFRWSWFRKRLSQRSTECLRLSYSLKYQERDDELMDVVFESKNILYVRPSFDLIPDYLEMVNDIEHVARFIGERREPYTEEEERSYMQSKMDQHATMFSMLERDTRQFIGNIEFMNRKGDEAEWGIVMTYKMQNKGYGTEALKRSVEYGLGELELRRIYLAVYADNPRAIHVYEKCGFREYDRNDVDVFMEAVREQGDFA